MVSPCETSACGRGDQFSSSLSTPPEVCYCQCVCAACTLCFSVWLFALEGRVRLSHIQDRWEKKFSKCFLPFHVVSQWSDICSAFYTFHRFLSLSFSSVFTSISILLQGGLEVIESVQLISLRQEVQPCAVKLLLHDLRVCVCVYARNPTDRHKHANNETER